MHYDIFFLLYSYIYARNTNVYNNRPNPAKNVLFVNNNISKLIFTHYPFHIKYIKSIQITMTIIISIYLFNKITFHHQIAVDIAIFVANTIFKNIVHYIQSIISIAKYIKSINKSMIPMNCVLYV